MNNAFFQRAALWLALAVSFLIFPKTVFAQYSSNGIYAEFNTSMGSYTCRLDYVAAPKAVANFIGLATGARSWLDQPSGLVKTNPFYNGTTFHRVITDFVNQGGSPDGTGTDGPGYAFVDEFTNTLRFNKYGVLAMANAGPDSNGAQFFVAATNSLPSLNDVHTIFGLLYGGSNVVYKINRVQTDANNKPLTNVVLQTVVIRRIGTTASNFNINAQGLPQVTNLNLKIAMAPGAKITLSYSNRLYADTRLYASDNLANWSGAPPGIETAAPFSNSITTSATAPMLFFRGAQIQYPSSTFAPRNVFGRTISMVFTSGASGTNVVTFDSVGGGTFNYAGSTGTVTGYNWFQAPYNGKFLPIGFSATVPVMDVKLNYDSPTVGTFTGTAYAVYPFIPYGPVGGTFTSSP